MPPRRTCCRSTSRRGFTLIELLVVVSIIAVLAALLLPAIGLVREMAHLARCGSNLRQVTMAATAYSDEWGILIPFNYGDYSFNNQPNAFWPILIRDYLPEMDSKVMNCPQSKWYEQARSNYSKNVWTGWYGHAGSTYPLIPWNKVRRKAATIWFADGRDSTWNTSEELIDIHQDWNIGWRHRGGQRANFAFCDGHIEVLDRVSAKTIGSMWHALPWKPY